MPKMKTRKSIAKRIKLTSKEKLLRKHQLGSGHLKRKKSKSALERQSKMIKVFKSDAKKYKQLIGV